MKVYEGNLNNLKNLLISRILTLNEDECLNLVKPLFLDSLVVEIKQTDDDYVFILDKFDTCSKEMFEAGFEKPNTIRWSTFGCSGRCDLNNVHLEYNATDKGFIGYMSYKGEMIASFKGECINNVKATLEAAYYTMLLFKYSRGDI